MRKNFLAGTGFAASAPAEGGGIAMYSPAFYAACTVGGVLSCGLTHTLVTPLDVVKCNMQARQLLRDSANRTARSRRTPAPLSRHPQVNPAKYKNIPTGFSLIVSEQGAMGLFKGWAPTAVGYSAQGACKFGFYEFFKKCVASREHSCCWRRGVVFARCRRAEQGPRPTGITPTWRAPPTRRSTRRASTWPAAPPPSSSPTWRCARSRPSRCGRRAPANSGGCRLFLRPFLHAASHPAEDTTRADTAPSLPSPGEGADQPHMGSRPQRRHAQVHRRGGLRRVRPLVFPPHTHVMSRVSHACFIPCQSIPRPDQPVGPPDSLHHDEVCSL